jgi:integrase
MRKPRHPVAFERAIVEFVAHQRVFGRRYQTEEWILNTLARFVGRHGAADLSASVFEQWCKSHRRVSPTTLYRRQLLVRKFCLFRKRHDAECFVPDPSGFTRPRPYRAPVIVTPPQVTAMLAAIRKLEPGRDSPLRQAVMRLAVVLLYTAGLRRGELVRLQLADVDSQSGVLHIRESKFHRSRWVPLSSSATRELRRYLRKRLRRPYDRQPAAPLLCNGHPAYERAKWHGYSGPGLAQGVNILFDLAGVRDTQGRRPRVQDIRHSYAVQALVRSYRHGEDVQTQLPKIALYMGHVSIVSTAYYLHFIPEVAALASQRFGRSFSHLIDSGTL